MEDNKPEVGGYGDEWASIIITGANSGLGYECAKSLLKGDWGSKEKRWYVIFACRDEGRTNEAIERIHKEIGKENMKGIARYMNCDLGSLASVRAFAKAVEDELATEPPRIPQLKALVLNAGLHIVNGTQFTQDGFESTFGVNHLGHFLLSQLLLPRLDAPARVIFVSSGTHDPALKTDMPPPAYTSARDLAYPEGDKGKDAVALMREGQCRYSTSKLCNLLCTYEMVRRLKDTKYGQEVKEGVPRVNVGAFDPGLMPGTGLARDYAALKHSEAKHNLPITLFISNSQNTVNSGTSLARMAADEQCNINNKYIAGRRVLHSSAESYDEDKAKELWDGSLELVGLPN